MPRLGPAPVWGDGQARPFAVERADPICRPGDILIVCAASGNSPLLERLAAAGTIRGVTTFVFSGDVLEGVTWQPDWIPGESIGPPPTASQLLFTILDILLEIVATAVATLPALTVETNDPELLHREPAIAAD
jgi:hypothetical protein